MMNFIREHKKISYTITAVLSIVLIVGIAYGRYIYNIVDNYILETKGFYFNSSVLSMNTREYSIINWDGVNDYTLTIDLNSRKNSLKSTESDITYDIDVSCDSSITCVPSKTSGTITESSKSDSYQIVVSTDHRINPGETVEVTTTVHSTSPYQKTLSAKYIIGVETSNFTYNIEDTANEHYMTLNLINSIPYYKVKTAFGDHKVGDMISLEDYALLTDAQKNNCFSAIVTVSFDPSVVYLDMTTKSYLHRISGSEGTTSVGGFNYVNKYSFKVNATSSEKILFYKADKSKNYTYPIVNSTSIIKVTTELAN